MQMRITERGIKHCRKKKNHLLLLIACHGMYLVKPKLLKFIYKLVLVYVYIVVIENKLLRHNE